LIPAQYHLIVVVVVVVVVMVSLTLNIGKTCIKLLRFEKIKIAHALHAFFIFVIVLEILYAHPLLFGDNNSGFFKLQ